MLLLMLFLERIVRGFVKGFVKRKGMSFSKCSPWSIRQMEYIPNPRKLLKAL